LFKGGKDIIVVGVGFVAIEVVIVWEDGEATLGN
jgi:hypothetical protein